MSDAGSETLNRVFAALSDPTRRGLLQRISRGEAAVTQLAEPLDMSLAAVSKHLRVLEDAGLITRRVEGRHHFLSARPDALDLVERWVSRQRAIWEPSFDRLARMLEENTPLAASAPPARARKSPSKSPKSSKRKRS